MHRARLLLAVPAAAALVFGGIAPASAGDDYKHRASGHVLSINSVERERGGLEVDFKYKCSTKDRKGVAYVSVSQGAAHYSGRTWLKCDGVKRSAEADLMRHNKHEVRKGAVHVKVELFGGNRLLDREYAKLRVSGGHKH